MTSYALVHDKNFISATRETGYRSTASAVAELIDNSVQAGAATIDIGIREEGTGAGKELTLWVLDDGRGMDRKVIQRALQFGGSTRFDDRNGLGRFGMGLPNSSASQARRLEVYSWRSRKNILFTYLDLDEIERGELTTVPPPKVTALPAYVPMPGRRGTLVLWRKCDRLEYRKASTLKRKLTSELGRIFRHHIWSGVTLRINGDPVLPIDPLFCHPAAAYNGADSYLEPLIYDIRVPGRRRTAQVVVRFSLLPVDHWHALPLQTKRDRGIVGGSGVSIVRAGREVAHGWFFMGSKRRQNYDDWWRCEISFEPALDEWFGVTHSKQGIRPTSRLSDILSPDVEHIARGLSARVRASFAAVARGGRSAPARATDRDWRLPRLEIASASGMRRRSRMSQIRYRVDTANLASPEFATWKLHGTELLLTLNRNHPFYRQVYIRPKDDESQAIQHDLECILLAFGRAVHMGDHEAGARLSELWSDVLATFVGE